MTGANVDSAQVIHMVENREMQRKLPDLEEIRVQVGMADVFSCSYDKIS